MIHRVRAFAYIVCVVEQDLSSPLDSRTHRVITRLSKVSAQHRVLRRKAESVRTSDGSQFRASVRSSSALSTLPMSARVSSHRSIFPELRRRRSSTCWTTIICHRHLRRRLTRRLIMTQSHNPRFGNDCMCSFGTSRMISWKERLSIAKGRPSSRSEFATREDAATAFEDYLLASKSTLTVSEIAKIRDHVGIIGMAGI